MLQSELPPEKEQSTSIFGRFFQRVDGCKLHFEFDNKNESGKARVDDLYGKSTARLHVYDWNEPIKGHVVLTPSGGSYAHSGVVVELVGSITIFREGEEKEIFLRQERRFEPDTLRQPTPFEFTFSGLKEYESYRGIFASVNYHIKATAVRPVKNLTGSEEVWVRRVNDELTRTLPDASANVNYFRETAFGPSSISMEVGVDNVLHIEFRYDKRVFHLDERVLGKVTFRVADMEITFGEVGLVRREIIHPGRPDETSESETLQKFEIMDGTPIVGEVVPIRLYLKSIPRLTPTYANIHNGSLSVRYFLNLVLTNEDGKRYFKQQEIELYRRGAVVAPSTAS